MNGATKSSTAGELREAVAVRIGAALPQFVAGLERSEWLVLADAALSALSPSGEPVSVAVEAVAWADLLTKAVGDITAALILAGKKEKIRAWTAPYIAAINQADAPLSKPTPVEAGLREDVDPCPACGALPCDWTDDPHKPIAGRGEAVRLGLEDAEYLERVAEEADDNGWLDWGAAMRQAAERLRVLSALSETQPPRETSTETKESGE